MRALKNSIMTIAATAGILIALFAVPSPTAAQGQLDEGSCEFSRQLQNPEEGLMFSAEVNAAREAARSPYGRSVSYSIPFSDVNGNSYEIDTFSFNCLTCHDGINTKVHNVRFKDFGQEQTASFQEVRGNHPIGMHYGSYAYAGNSFRNLYDVAENTVLVDGKVGCLTCHNPLLPEKKHLARKNLCMGCHIK